MEFTIAEKPLDALKSDLALYHRLSLKLRTSCASDVVLHSRLEQLFEAELSDILSLLYYGWKHDCMESMLDRRLSGSSSKQVRADFGSTEKRQKCLLTIMHTLFEMDMNVISGNVELMCLYDDLISYIADHDTHDDAMMLYDYDFWDLYFGFYEGFKEAEGGKGGESGESGDNNSLN